MSSPIVEQDHLHFSLLNDDPSITGVTLECDPAIAGSKSFSREGLTWVLALPSPPLQRFEYRFVLTRTDGAETILDPGNDLRVDTAFGERSVAQLPGYELPWWLQEQAPQGTYDALSLAGETDEDVPVTVWSPADSQPHDALPLLLVQDGPEYDLLSSLTHYSAVLIDRGVLPAHRVALAHPVLRDAWYSGSPSYLRTIAAQGLARIEQRYAVQGPVAVMGASLGGLTALLVGMIATPQIGAVFAQSGSFFQPRLDGSESGFRYFHRISEAVRQILDARTTDHPLRIGLTCGAHEENAANNRQMAQALAKAGHWVSHTEVADLHNYTAWRDALDPHLTEVLRDAWGHRQG